MKSGDLTLKAYLAADAGRRRMRAAGTFREGMMGAMVWRAYAALRRLRSIARVQRNRDAVERCDLGGEG